MTDGREKSDRVVVPMKSPNNAGQPAAEETEGRTLAKGNSQERNAPRTQRRTSTPSALERVRQAAKKDKKQRFTALLHHVYDVERLQSAYGSLKRDAAAGIDGETWRHYGESLEDNLQDLSKRLQHRAYRAKPVRTTYIPKADGRLRPLGVPVLEDKIVQRATAEVLNTIYEADFLGFSYGFRPGRSQHDALDALSVGIWARKVKWVLDADIRSFFDTMKHEWIVKFIEHRIADERVVRLTEKWLSAGVLSIMPPNLPRRLSPGKAAPSCTGYAPHSFRVGGLVATGFDRLRPRVYARRPRRPLRLRGPVSNSPQAQ